MDHQSHNIDKSIISKFYEYITSSGIMEYIPDEIYLDDEDYEDDGVVITLVPSSVFDVEHNIDYIIIGEGSNGINFNNFYRVYQNGNFREATEQENQYFDDKMFYISTKELSIYPTITTYDWNEIKRRTLNTVWKMNESSPKYIKKKNTETFIQWLSIKLQREIGDKIGKGIEGSVYDFGDSKVIKITSTDVIQLYNVINKNIKGIAKIYHIGYIVPPYRFKIDKNYIKLGGVTKISNFKDFKNLEQNINLRDGKIGYVIMEKVDTSVGTPIEELSNILREKILNNKTKWDGLDLTISFNSDVLNKLYNNLVNNYSKLIQYLTKIFNGKLPTLLEEVLEVFINVGKVYPNWDDIHSGQFGRNNKGELVVFDIGNEDEKYGGDLSPYPTPKNIIKENININDIPPNVKKSYIELIGTDEYFNHNNQLYYDGKIGWDPDPTSVIIYKSNISLLRMKLYGYEYEYYVRSFMSSGYEKESPTTARQYYFYDEKIQKFRNANTKKDRLKSDDRVKTFANLLFSMDISGNLKSKYDVIYKYTYEDWKKNQEGTLNTIKQINENDIPLTLKDVPSDIKNGYIGMIQSEFQFNKNNELVYNKKIDTEYYQSSISLSKVKSKYFIKSYVNTEGEKEYNKNSYNTSTVSHIYYYYSDIDKKFIDIKTLPHDDMMSIRKFLFSSQQQEIIANYTYNDWVKNLDGEYRILKKINEGNIIGFDSVPTDVKKAFAKDTIEDSHFNRKNQEYIDSDDYMNDDDTYIPYYSEKWLIDISKDLLFNTDYIIKTSILDEFNKDTYYKVYNKETKSFNTSDSKTDKNIALKDDGFSGGLESIYPAIYNYSVEDWMENQRNTLGAVIKINESNTPTPTTTIPNDVKRAFSKFIQEEQDFNNNNEAFYRREDDEDDYDEDDWELFYSGIYLFEFNKKDWIYNGSDNFDPLYIIKVITQTSEDDRTRYFKVYDQNTQTFIYLPEELDDEVTDSDNNGDMENYEIVLMSYGYEDWLDNKEKTFKALKKINESNNLKYLFQKDVRENVKKAFIIYVANNKKFNDFCLDDYRWREDDEWFEYDEDRENFEASISLFDISKKNRSKGI